MHALIIPREGVNLGLMKLGFWKIFLGVAIVVGLVAVNYYNSFVTQKNAIDGQWKQVEVQYQRRFDLIPI